MDLINILGKGEIFGEIAMMSTLKRTCTVIANNYMMVQSLSRQSLNLIEQNAPNVYNQLQSRLELYNDEDMEKRFLYLRNIPFLRKLSRETVRAITFTV